MRLVHPDFVPAKAIPTPDERLVLVDWTGAGRTTRTAFDVPEHLEIVQRYWRGRGIDQVRCTLADVDREQLGAAAMGGGANSRLGRAASAGGEVCAGASALTSLDRTAFPPPVEVESGPTVQEDQTQQWVPRSPPHRAGTIRQVEREIGSGLQCVGCEAQAFELVEFLVFVFDVEPTFPGRLARVPRGTWSSTRRRDRGRRRRNPTRRSRATAAHPQILPVLSGEPAAPDTPSRSSNSHINFLRTLRATRERGYAISDEDVTPGVASVGVPIFDHTGTVKASL
jgi:Bacterial transcriptional regulator